jgi:hypothetical protein
MAKRTLPWLPWLLAEGTLGFLQAQQWPTGGLWLLLLWTAALLAYRAAIGQISHRGVRLYGDLVFGVLCALAVFEGGWYLLPAVVAFAACDAAGLSITLPSLPDDRERHELDAAVGSTLLGWAALAIFVSGPMYSSATSTVDANGVVVNSPPMQASLLQAGLAPQTATLLATIALLFGLVTVLTAVYVRTRRREAWRALVAVTVLLLVPVILAWMTVGLWLVPGVVLALVAVRLGRSVQPSRQATSVDAPHDSAAD